MTDYRNENSSSLNMWVESREQAADQFEYVKIMNVLATDWLLFISPSFEIMVQIWFQRGGGAGLTPATLYTNKIEMISNFQK